MESVAGEMEPHSGAVERGHSENERRARFRVMCNSESVSDLSAWCIGRQCANMEVTAVSQKAHQEVAAAASAPRTAIGDERQASGIAIIFPVMSRARPYVFISPNSLQL